jgi:hypothetical protein
VSRKRMLLAQLPHGSPRRWPRLLARPFRVRVRR